MTIILALEEQSLSGLNREDTFPLLMVTLKKVLAINRKSGCDCKLVAAPMVYPVEDTHRPLHAKMTARNAVIESFN